MSEPRTLSSALWRVAALAVLASAAFPAPDPSLAADRRPGVMTEYEAKANFLFVFTAYVEWPERAFENPTEPFVIGIFGADPFGSDIDRLANGKRGRGRAITIRRLNDLDQAKQCHIVFISRADRHRQAAILNALEGEPILTVGETDWFLEDGGGVRLFTMRDEEGKNRTRFAVNPEALDHQGLTASFRMMRYAEPTAD